MGADAPDSVRADAPDAVRVDAPAKVNLGLAVTARRGDGFHELETVFARIDLHDEVAVAVVTEAHGAPGEQGAEARGDRSVTLTVDGDQATAALPTDDRNLVVRAADEYRRRAGTTLGAALPWVRIGLTKRIPVAAGLGGGSSDAAATLIALDRLLPAAVDLPSLALALGSDVPYFLRPDRAALARGRGERLSAVELPALDLVLAKPPFGVSAAEAYASLVGFTPRLRVDDILTALARGDEPGWRNALQPGVMRSYPLVREVIAELKGAGLRGCIMSGSGPTCLGLAANRVEAEALAARISRVRPNWWVRAVSVR